MDKKYKMMTSWRENLKLCLCHKKVEHPAQQKNQVQEEVMGSRVAVQFLHIILCICRLVTSDGVEEELSRQLTALSLGTGMFSHDVHPTK